MGNTQKRGKGNKMANGKHGREIKGRKRVGRIQWLVSSTIIELNIKENDLKLHPMTFSVLRNFKRNSRPIARTVEIIYCLRARQVLLSFSHRSLLLWGVVYPLAKSLHILAINIYICIHISRIAEKTYAKNMKAEIERIEYTKYVRDLMKKCTYSLVLQSLDLKLFAITVTLIYSNLMFMSSKWKNRYLIIILNYRHSRRCSTKWMK